MRRRIAVVTILIGIASLIVWLFDTQFRAPMDAENCANNLHVIGYGVLLYASDHNGHWPDSLSEVMLKMGSTPQTFICPASNDTPAPGANTAAQANNLTGEHLSYVYLGRGIVEPVPDGEHLVIGYEREAFHGRRGLNILFADGHVQLLARAEASRFLNNARNVTGPITWPPPR